VNFLPFFGGVRPVYLCKYRLISYDLVIPVYLCKYRLIRYDLTDAVYNPIFLVLYQLKFNLNFSNISFLGSPPSKVYGNMRSVAARASERF
jgi:hypothetical protein